MAEGKFPEVVSREAVTLIETRESTLRRKVEGILRHVGGSGDPGAPAALRDQRFAASDGRGVIERLGKGVAPANRETRLQALADGIMDASILISYEARYRPAERHEPKWLALQAGKVERALAALEAAPPGIDSPPDVGQITLACTLGYRDFRFNGSWRGEHPRLVAWLDQFAARVPAFAATKPPG